MIYAIVGQALLGWLLADLLSGLFHWWEDRVLTERAPLVGRLLVPANRLHHVAPMAFAANTLWQRSGLTFVAAGLASLVWLLLAGPSVLWASTSLAGLLSTEIHYWAHTAARQPRLVRVLQATGLLQSPAHHARHHRPPSTNHYCVISDWLNPVLDALGVWRALESVTRAATASAGGGTPPNS